MYPEKNIKYYPRINIYIYTYFPYALIFVPTPTSPVAFGRHVAGVQRSAGFPPSPGARFRTARIQGGLRMAALRTAMAWVPWGNYEKRLKSMENDREIYLEMDFDGKFIVEILTLILMGHAWVSLGEGYVKRNMFHFLS